MPTFVRPPRGRRPHQPRVIPWMKLTQAELGTTELEWGVGGVVDDTTELEWGVGGVASAEVTLQWAVAPSPLRIAYALSGEFGPVIASMRYERRTKTNQFLEDVTAAVTRCRISANNNRANFRTAEFTIDPAEATIDPNADHIAVFEDLLVDGNYVLELQWGLFALAYPEKTIRPRASGGNYETWEVGADDVGYYLATDGPGEPYTIDSGENYFTGTGAIADILDDLGLEHALPAVTATLPASKTWPSTATWRDICNFLTDGVNHYAIKPDAAGKFRTQPRLDLSTRTPDVIYQDTDWLLIPIQRSPDTSRFANKIIATCDNPLLSSVALNDDPDSPISTVSLGRTITRRIPVDAVADQTTLDAIAAQYLRDAANVYERVAIETHPDPRREANEVYALTVDDLWDGALYAAQDWEVELASKPNPRMKHNVGKVAPVVVS